MKIKNYSSKVNPQVISAHMHFKSYVWLGKVGFEMYKLSGLRRKHTWTKINTMNCAIIRHLDAQFWPHEFRYHPKALHLRFLVDNVTLLTHFFLRVLKLPFSPCHFIIPPGLPLFPGSVWEIQCWPKGQASLAAAQSANLQQDAKASLE